MPSNRVLKTGCDYVDSAVGEACTAELHRRDFYSPVDGGIFELPLFGFCGVETFVQSTGVTPKRDDYGPSASNN